MKKMSIGLLICVLILVGCQGDENKVTDGNTENSLEKPVSNIYTDVLGREVNIDSKPQRVVALYASFGDLWYEAGGDLVGIIEASNLPKQSLDLPKVGNMSTPNIEAILSLEPDLIILRAGYSAHDDLIDIFVQSNIAVFSVDYNSFEETMAIFKTFTSMNDRQDLYLEKAEPLITTVNALTSENEAFDYLLLFATSKSISTKDDNITSKIIDDLGGYNITKSYQVADETTKQFSLEKILELDPTYIFVQTMGDIENAKLRLEEDVISNPAWSSLTAVKEKKFIYLPKELFLYKPNMKYLEAYETIKKILEE